MTSLSQKAALTDRELALLASEMPNKQKSLAVAFLLWFFLGTLGIYNFYLGNKRRGWFMVILTIVAIITFIVIVGIVILLGLAVVWIIDAVRMGTRVQEANTAIEGKVIAEIIAGRAAAQAASS